MGMKFLNKKGWHTGSLRNIENVWKAEQKDEAEKRKLEELRKQIHEERERDEFRQLQEQAGFTPRQERLEFLYDSGLSVGKTSNEGFSSLQSCPPAAQTSNSASASAAQPSSSNIGPGALFEEKPQSANDSWRKLHSDPLLMIRQREQEALARIKNNPVKMAMIRKSVETKKKDDEAHDGKKKRVKSKHKRHSSSKHDEDDSDDDEQRKKRKSNHRVKKHLVSDEDSSDKERHHTHPRKDSSDRRNGNPVNRRQDRNEDHEHLDTDRDLRDRRNGSSRNRRQDRNEGHEHLDTVKDSRDRRNGSPRNRRRDRNEKLSHGKYPSDSQDDKSTISDIKHAALPPKPESHRRRGRAPQLSEEERAARLREMQMDAELHEENRWKRLKKAEEEDAKEASKATISRGGGSFLDTVHKSVYGAEKGGSSTIEESVRRRSHFLQGRTQVDEQNAFRR